jgi:hypothetical protein
MATRFNGIVNVDTRDSMPDWTPFEPPKASGGVPTPLCSPTRSCLLTGRNHTRNSMACITAAAVGFPNASDMQLFPLHPARRGRGQ